MARRTPRLRSGQVRCRPGTTGCKEGGARRKAGHTKVGTFTQKLYDEAKKKGWSVISMKNDWKRVFAFE
jgi:hypothetical protein